MDRRNIKVACLRLDEQNARLEDPQEGEALALLALMLNEGTDVLNLAEDIVAQGQLSPLDVAGVVPIEGADDEYLVLEGNRRVAALKILESPQLVSGTLTSKRDRDQLESYHESFVENPIDEIFCYVATRPEELEHWITLRHTGKNEGRGLSSWGPRGQDRYIARHGSGIPSPRTQVLDFVEQMGLLSDGASESKRQILSTVQRVIHNRDVAKEWGFDIVDGVVVSSYPPEEIAKPFTRLVEDLKTGKQDSRTLNKAKAVRSYAKSLPAEDRPDDATRLDKPVQLGETGSPPKKRKKSPSSGGGASPSRKKVIPTKVALAIPDKRIAKIAWELKNLNAERFANSAGVLFRVFLELSVDHYRDLHALGKAGESLGKKMKSVAQHLFGQGQIDKPTLRMVERRADGGFFYDAAAVTFHQWVHNPKTSPDIAQLRSAWDELEPFFVKVWP